uniref:40S ribosomal protein S3 n=1 Tax=Globodera rostochiensis TaxID=31243 RepID=A0A914GW17_GLORO
MAQQQAITKKRKAVQDGIFKAELNNFLMKELAEDGYSGVEVRRAPSRTEVIIMATRTQSVLGERGKRIRELTALVQKRFGYSAGQIELYAEKVSSRGLCAVAQCESLRYKLVGGLAVRRACYGVLRFIMESGARGCEIVVSGKLRGQRAKAMKFVDGVMIHSGHPVIEYIQEAVRHVQMRQGVLGIKVKIMLPHDPKGQQGPRNPLPDHIQVKEPPIDVVPTTPYSEHRDQMPMPMGAPPTAPQLQPPSGQMSGGVYGGDDVGALVFDPGSHSFRVGYGGEEFPRYDIPARIGVRPLPNVVDDPSSQTTTDATIEEVATGRKQQQRDGIKFEQYIGTTRLNLPRADMEVKPYMREGMVEDWDLFEKMLDYIYGPCLGAESREHGALFTEPPWNPKEKRQRLTELVFEKYGAPAYYLAKNAVLAAFASGRTAGLVIDSGATHTSAVPVYDGYCVTNSVVKSPEGVDIVPYYKVASKREVKEGDAPIWTTRANLPPVTQSYESYMSTQVVEDLIQSILQLCEAPIDYEFMDKLPAVQYGFPCGYRRDFHAERAKIPEALFDLKHADLSETERATLMSVAQVALTSCNTCDIDIRPSLYSNLIVTGGNSLIVGFTDRLNHDLAQNCPSTIKIRVSNPNYSTSTERRFGAWIGGSIVSSLGTFQQLWISKGEYEESGKSIVERKCP